MAARPSQQVFISYQRSDDAIARQVRERLVRAGVHVWMDQFNIPVGAYWPDELDRALAAADTVVGILSPDAVASRNVKNEWDWTIQNEKRLLLLQAVPCALPHRYISINYIDATGPDPEPAIAALLQTLGVAITEGVAALAAPGEILITGTVEDLTAGAGIRFDDRGMHTLAGLPDEWRILGVDAGNIR